MQMGRYKTWEITRVLTLHERVESAWRGREKQGDSSLGDGGAIPQYPESRRRLDILSILSPSIVCPVEPIPMDISTGQPDPVPSGWAWPLGSTSRDQRVGGGSSEGVYSPAPSVLGCRLTLTVGPFLPLSLGAWPSPFPLQSSKVMASWCCSHWDVSPSLVGFLQLCKTSWRWFLY